MGKKGRWVTPENAMQHVLGYTIANDVTARDLQRRDGQWTRGKGFDTFCPIGPWIETDASPGAMETIVRLNGVERVRFATNAMVFGIATFISTMTRYLTLYPGDVIWMGTDGESPYIKGGRSDGADHRRQPGDRGGNCERLRA